MNRTISENSMFIDGISHERNIHAWVRIPNGTTVYKRASLLILPKYKTPRWKLFWTHSQALSTDEGFSKWWETATSIILFENFNPFISIFDQEVTYTLQRIGKFDSSRHTSQRRTLTSCSYLRCAVRFMTSCGEDFEVLAFGTSCG